MLFCASLGHIPSGILSDAWERHTYTYTQKRDRDVEEERARGGGKRGREGQEGKMGVHLLEYCEYFLDIVEGEQT